MRRHSSAFTLIELAMVLAVIGLVIGGISVGNDMLRSAFINSVVSDVTKFRGAFAQFRSQYRGWPGDLPTATSYWGARDGGDGLGTDCTSADSSGSMLTCNGNGNEKIYSSLGDGYEAFRAWQHLSNAGLITGSFTGISGPHVNGTQCIIGTNCPASKKDYLGYGAAIPTGTGMSGLVIGTSHILGFGGSTSSNLPYAAGFTALDAYRLDVKLDDGKPGSGTTIGPSSVARSHCTSSAVPTTAYYLVDDPLAKACHLIFVL